MSITLRIASYQRLTPEQEKSYRTDLSRFSIGRLEENDWVLPDPQKFLSGTHCWLEFQNGNWVLSDTSTNGVFLNGSTQRVNRNASIQLTHGDLIRMGDYELEVDLTKKVEDFGELDSTIQGQYPDPPGKEAGDSHSAEAGPGRHYEKPSRDPNTPISQLDNNLIGVAASIDQLHKLDIPENKHEVPQSLMSRGDQLSPLHQHYSPPPVIPSNAGSLPAKYAVNPEEIPHDWNEPTDMIPKPKPQATGAGIPASQNSPGGHSAGIPASQNSPGGHSAIAAFAAGAGLDASKLGSRDEVRLFHEIGELLRTMTEGIMQTVAARRQIKSEFRLEVTMIGPSQNNPLKFSVNPQEALLRLLSSDESGYLSGREAAASVFNDINAHQLAVMAGTETALKSIFRGFKPSDLESHFGNDSILSRLFPALRKAKLWEFYKRHYHKEAEAADDNFNKLFGNEFAEAYKRQLDRIKSQK